MVCSAWFCKMYGAADTGASFFLAKLGKDFQRHPTTSIFRGVEKKTEFEIVVCVCVRDLKYTFFAWTLGGTSTASLPKDVP